MSLSAGRRAHATARRNGSRPLDRRNRQGLARSSARRQMLFESLEQRSLLAGADAFASAPLIPAGASFVDPTDTFSYTMEAGEPATTIASNPVGQTSAWWKVAVPTAGIVTIHTYETHYPLNQCCGAAFGGFGDTTLEVFSGTALNNLVLVTNNDDINALPGGEAAYPYPGSNPQGYNPNSRVSFAATPGQTYYVRLNGWGDDFVTDPAGGGDRGLTQFTYSFSSDIYVDDAYAGFANGQVIADADLGTNGAQPATFNVNAFATINAALAAAATSGTIIVNGGTYAESVALDNTRTLRIGGPDAGQTVAINALASISGTTINIAGSSTLSAGDAASTTIAGVITGSGNFTKTGTGTLTLSGTNTYTGATNINAGTLRTGAPISTTNLLAYYDFNDPNNLGRDSSANANNATVQGGAVGMSAGIIGTGALALPAGGAGYLQMPDLTPLFAGQAATLSVWTRLNVATPGDSTLTGFANLGSGSNDHYPWVNGLSYQNVFRNNRVDNIALLPTVDRAQWHLVTIVSDPTDAANGWRMYQNGTLISSTSPSWGISGFQIGVQNGFFLNGFVDDVRLYNRALSTAEVQAIYNINVIPDTSSITVAAGATLDLGNHEAIGSLAGMGSVNLNGNTLLAGGNNTNTTYGGTIAGTGGLTKTGTGTLTLSGANTYSGATNVLAGTLKAGVPISTTNLLAYYDFNDPNNLGRDSSANANNASVQGGATASGAGAVGGALAMPAGAGGYLQMPDLTPLFAGQAATLSVWTKLNIATPTDPVLTGFANLGSGSNDHYPWVNGLSYQNIFRNNRVDNIGLLPSVDRTQWHLVTIVNDPTDAANGWRMYQNGTLISSTSPSWGISGFQIGVQNGFFLNGFVDDVRLYNRALSTAEIQAIYNVNVIPDNSAVVVSPGATFDIGNHEAIGSLAGMGSVNLNGSTLFTGGNNATTTYGGAIIGTGGLTKTGTGALTLSGANTYTGATNVLTGTLNLGGTGTLPTIPGLYEWFDAADAATISQTGGLISQWRDKSGAGRHLNQSTVANQPTLVAGAINGNSLVRFDGNDVIFNAAGNNTNTPYTVLSAARMEGTQHSRLLTSTGNNWLLGYWGGNMDQLYADGSVRLGGGPTPDIAMHFYGALGTGTQSTLLDGNRLIAQNNGGVTAPNGISLGAWQGNAANEASKGDVAELLVFRGVLTPGQLAEAYAYLHSKWLVGGAVLSDVSAVTVAASANLNVNVAEAVGNLAGSGTTTLNRTLTVNETGATSYAGIMQGAAGLTKTGAGTLTLAGPNTYSGATAITGGTLIAASSTALGATTGGTSVAAGATLALSGNIAIGAEAIAAAGSGVDGLGAIRNLAGNNALGGPITLLPTIASAGAAAVSLSNATAAASFSQGGFSPAHMVDGLTALNAGGWANAGNAVGSNAAFETFTNLNPSGAPTELTFSIFSGGYGNHTIGKFKLFVTTDDRANFANGAINNGQIGSNWTELTPISATSVSGTTLTINTDNSIRASGADPGTDTFTIKALTNLANITGVRIETIKDPGLPSSGPGRAGNGNYVIVEWNVLAATLDTANLTIGSDAGSLALNGTITNPVANGSVTVIGKGDVSLGSAGGISQTSGATNVIKNGVGTLTNSGANNNFAGSLAINGGTYIAASNSAFGSTAAGTSVANDATVAFTGGIAIGNEALTVSGVNGSAQDAIVNLAGNNTFAGSVTVAPYTFPIGTTTGVITGGDPGEGLDLTGNFVFAINTGGPVAGPVQGLNFTSTEGAGTPGVTFSSPNVIGSYTSPNYGTTTNDDNLEVVMRSIRWNVGPVSFDLSGLTVGHDYKLQLLFSDAYNPANRRFHITTEGVTRETNFTSGATTSNPVFTQIYQATDSVLNILLSPGTFGDTNPIISGITLEDLGVPVARDLNIRSDAGALALNGAVGLNASVLTVKGPGNVTLGGAVTETGASSLVKTGTGALTLAGSASNTFSGGTIVDNGSLYLNKSAGAVALASAVQMGAGNANQPNLRMQQSNQFGPGVVMTFANANGNWARFDLAATNQTLAGINAGTATTQAGAVIQNVGLDGVGTGTGTLTVNGSGTYLYHGYFRDQDNGGTTNKLGLIKSGTGTQTISGLNVHYTGTTLVNSGTLQLIDTRGYRSPTTVNAPGVWELNSSSAIPTAVPRWLFGQTLAGNGTVNKTGAGGFGMIGVNNFAGLIQIQQGVIFNDNLTANWNGSTADVAISSGATLDLRGNNVTIDALTGAGSVINSYGNGTNLLTIGAAGGSGVFTGTISGAGSGAGGDGNGRTALSKIGAGTLQLAGANTYGGATTVAGGTLLVNNSSGSATGSGDVTVNSGATLGGNGSLQGNVSVSGTLSPGLTPGGFGTLAIGGNLALLTNSTYALDANATTNDLTTATNITIDPTANLAANVTPGIVGGEAIIFLDAATSATGQFATGVPDLGTDRKLTLNSIETYFLSNGDPNDRFADVVATQVAIIRNSPVDARANTYTMLQNSVLTGNVKTDVDDADDVDVDPDTDATVSLLGPGPTAAQGILSLSGDGSFTFTPKANFQGVVTFQYLLSDGENTDAATVTINVTNILVDADGNLQVGGSTGADRIVIQSSSGGLAVRYNNVLSTAYSVLGKVIVFGNAGSDTITVTGVANVPVQFHGGAGNDYLAGGSLDDILDGGEGSDRLLGGAGIDTLYGGADNDTLSGGVGDDTLYGDSYLDSNGDPQLPPTAQQGKDNLSGDAGNDKIYGEGNADTLYGGAGSDLVRGGEGNDIVNGDDGDDTLTGDGGGDRLYGRAGNDVLLGGIGLDTLYGGTGEDLLFGNAMDDETDATLEAIYLDWFGFNQASAAQQIKDAARPAEIYTDALYGEGGSDWYLMYITDRIAQSTEKAPANTIDKF